MLILRFFFALLLLQALTLLLGYLALHVNLFQNGILLLAVSLLVNVIFSFWFSSWAANSKLKALAEKDKDHARALNKLRTQVHNREQKTATRHQHDIEKIMKQNARRSLIQTTTIAGGLVVLGGVLIASQMMTLGLMSVVAAGGGLLGYSARMRQERATAQKLLLEIGSSQSPDTDHSTKKLTQSPRAKS